MDVSRSIFLLPLQLDVSLFTKRRFKMLLPSLWSIEDGYWQRRSCWFGRKYWHDARNCSYRQLLLLNKPESLNPVILMRGGRVLVKLSLTTVHRYSEANSLLMSLVVRTLSRKQTCHCKKSLLLGNIQERAQESPFCWEHGSRTSEGGYEKSLYGTPFHTRTSLQFTFLISLSTLLNNHFFHL